MHSSGGQPAVLCPMDHSGSGRCVKMPCQNVRGSLAQDPSFRQLIVCYMEALLTQTMQSVACNAVHPVEARCARWILMMRDRSDSNELSLTQEFLAQILSVHRSSVALATSTLQQAGFIQARRGILPHRSRGAKSASCGASASSATASKLLPNVLMIWRTTRRTDRGARAVGVDGGPGKGAGPRRA